MSAESSTAHRGRPRTLDVDRVVDAALAVLDEEGSGGLSVRAVAQRLGVRPNAIYTYLPDRAALERAVVERVLRRSDPSLLDGPARSWRRRILTYASALRSAMLAHPGSVPLFLTGPMDGPMALAVGEGLLAALADAGLPPETAARASYVLIVQVVGSVALEVAETDGRSPLPPEQERAAARLAAFRQVDPSQWPRSAAAAPVMAEWVCARQFAWALERVLAGLVQPHRP